MNKRKIIIAGITVIVIILVLFGIIKLIGNNQDNRKRELADLKEQRIQLETRKNEVFIESGFSEEYHRIDDELFDINKKISKYESSTGPTSIFFTIFGLIFVLIFGFAFINIFRTISLGHKLTKSAPNNINTENNTEDIEKMANILGKVAADMAINMNPEYKSLKCPNCGAALKDNVEVCEYCDSPLIRVAGSKK